MALINESMCFFSRHIQKKSIDISIIGRLIDKNKLQDKSSLSFYTTHFKQSSYEVQLYLMRGWK